MLGVYFCLSKRSTKLCWLPASGLFWISLKEVVGCDGGYRAPDTPIWPHTRTPPASFSTVHAIWTHTVHRCIGSIFYLSSPVLVTVGKLSFEILYSERHTHTHFFGSLYVSLQICIIYKHRHSCYALFTEAFFPLIISAMNFL